MIDFKREIEKELTVYYEFIHETQKAILETQKKIQTIYKEDIAENPEDADALEFAYEEDFYKHFTSFPSILYNSVFVSLYSFFEFKLIELSKSVELENNLRIKLSDISGENIINKGYRYFKLILGIDLTSIENTWLNITKFQKIRNCIVHDNASIWKERDKEIKRQQYFQIISSNEFIKLNHSDGRFFIYSEKFVLDFIDQIKLYLFFLIDQIKQIDEDYIRQLKNKEIYNSGSFLYDDGLPF